MFSLRVTDGASRPAFSLVGKALRLAVPFRTSDRFVAIGIALVLAICAGDAIVIEMQRESTIAAYETAGGNLSRGMSAQTSEILKVAGKVLAGIERNLAIAAIEDPERIDAALRERGAPALANGAAQTRAAALIDASGKVVASRIDGLEAGADASGDEPYRRLRSTDGPDVVVDAPRQDREGVWNFHLARRLKGAGGAFAGVALLQLPVREFEDFYRLAMPPQREVTVMTRDGTILVHYPHKDGLVGSKALMTAGSSPGPQSCSAFDGHDPVDNAVVVAVLCQLKHAALILETSASEDAVLDPWRHERLWLGLSGVFAALGVLWPLRAFARQVRRLQVSERSLETARSQLEIALANIAQGVSFLDAEQRLLVANDRYLELYGLSREDVTPRMPLAEILRRADKRFGFLDLQIDAFTNSLEASGRENKPEDLIVRFKNGRILAVRRQPLPDGSWVATHEDVTERRRAEEKISFLAKHDPLTGLANRSLLIERLQALQERGPAAGFAILFLDLDRFKAVNDRLGHDVGDELLRQAAARMMATVRARDTVARFGGDEFVVLQSDASSREDAARLARRLIEAAAAPFVIEDHVITVGASVGIEIPNDPGAAPDVLIKRADIALYASKSHGRGAYTFFEPHMDARLQSSDAAA